MKINVKKLDATIEKLTQLRRLATDPALADFIEITGTKTAPNGSGPDANGNGHGALKANVLAACKAQSGNFTIKAVYQTMVEGGTSEYNEKSVANMLRALADEHAIKIAVQGKGRRATEYSNN